jgi:hypothetical protein
MTNPKIALWQAVFRTIDESGYIQNGLLLRSDIHTLFDCGLIAIDPVSKKLILSSQLLRGSYRHLAGRKLRVPKEPAHAPSTEALRQHRRSTGL